MATREEVYDALDTERLYQDSRWGPTMLGGKHSLTEFAYYMEDYLRELKTLVSRTAQEDMDDRDLHIMRKITALGVACMEQNGAPKRF